MMRPVGDDLKVYLYRKTVDMRRGRNGLAAIAREAMSTDVFSGALYIFVGRRFDTVKILYWHRCGFAVWHIARWLRCVETTPQNAAFSASELMPFLDSSGKMRRCTKPSRTLAT